LKGRALDGAARKDAMAKVLDMPKLSPTMEQGRLARWHVKPGDAI
jgi:hypothetical protein